MVQAKFKDNVVSGVKSQDELPYHISKIGPPFDKWPILMDHSRVPGNDSVWAFYNFVNVPEKIVLPEPLQYAAPHRHPAGMDELYLVFGSEGAVTVEVQLDHRIFEVSSPGAVYIPSGVTHGICPTAFEKDAKGGVIAICNRSTYTCEPPANIQADRVGSAPHPNINREVRMIDELAYHRSNFPVKWPIIMDRTICSASKMWAFYAYLPQTPESKSIKPEDTLWADPHRHPPGTDELYCVAGEDQAVTVEVGLDGERYRIASPGAVFIPAGTTHFIKPVDFTPGKAGGIIAVVTNGAYECLPPIEHDWKEPA